LWVAYSPCEYPSSEVLRLPRDLGLT